MNNDNTKKMSEDEVSRELKIVQLQREKIQLEKELAQKQRVEKVSEALESSGNFFFNSVRLLRRNFFKIVVFITIIVAGIAGFQAIETSQIEAFYKGKDAYLLQTCGEPKGILSCGMMDSECSEREMNRSICYTGAEARYRRENAPALFFRKVY